MELDLLEDGKHSIRERKRRRNSTFENKENSRPYDRSNTHLTTHVASDGRRYYYNSVTKQSTWETPGHDRNSKAESKRWADMISILNAEVDALKSVGLLKYSRKAKLCTGSSGSHIFGGIFEKKYVAVKKILNESVQKETQLYGLMKTKAMSNVLKILHIEKDEDFTYVVTELCEYDLKHVIEDPQNPVGHNLTPEKRLKLCVDILRGLKDLHSIDVIHRDLKPSNILIDVDGDAFVADFGISINLIGETTQFTSCFGTLCWIARESYQSSNEKGRYKKESDVQAVGCLIYYVLSNGHHPFEATDPFINDTAKLMSNVVEGKFSLLHVTRYPAQCIALLKRMLDQDMLKRPIIDECLKEMEAVKKSYTSSIKTNSLTIDDEENTETENLLKELQRLQQVHNETETVLRKPTQEIPAIAAAFSNFQEKLHKSKQSHEKTTKKLQEAEEFNQKVVLSSNKYKSERDQSQLQLSSLQKEHSCLQEEHSSLQKEHYSIQKDLKSSKKANTEVRKVLQQTEEILQKTIQEKNEITAEFKQWRFQHSLDTLTIKERRKGQAESEKRDSSTTVSLHTTAYLPECLIAGEFSRLIVKVSTELTHSHCVLLARYFNFTAAKIEIIKKERDNETLGIDVLDKLTERNIINMYDVTNLQQVLVDLKLNNINETLVTPYLRKIDPRIYKQHKITSEEH